MVKTLRIIATALPFLVVIPCLYGVCDDMARKLRKKGNLSLKRGNKPVHPNMGRK